MTMRLGPCPTGARREVTEMAEIIEMQESDPEVPGEEKASNVSYAACHNSFQSQMLCWRP